MLFAGWPFHAQGLPDQRPRPAASLHNVLSQQKLKAALREVNLHLRFSPDGRFLLVQSSSGFFVFSTNPLRPILYLDADNLFEARFSADSRSLTIVSFALKTARWRLPEVVREMHGELPAPGGCLAGELSPDGDSFACYRPDLGLQVYDVASGEVFLSDKPQHDLPGAALSPISDFSGNLLAQPVGYLASKTYDLYANRDLAFETIRFSPDSHSVLVATSDGAAIWDLSSKRKSNLPGIFKKPRDGSLFFLDNDRVLSFPYADAPQILSLKSGKPLARLPFDSAFVTPTANPHYVVVSSNDSARRVFDLDSNKFVDVPESTAIDVFENKVAAATAGFHVALFALGTPAPFASASLPPESTPSRILAAASPALDFLSLGFTRHAALFRLSDGTRVASLESTSETTIPDASAAYFLTLPEDDTVRELLRVDTATGKVTPVTRFASPIVRTSPAAFYDYNLGSATRETTSHPHFPADGGLVYDLTGGDLATGRILWKKLLSTPAVFPFPDPQGKRIVLGWRAKTPGGEAAARRCPRALPVFRKAKLNPRDTFFEVLDGSTAATIGGILVQSGSGPLTFDSVFSAGSMLLASKDEGRAVLYSLDDGELKAHLNGFLPAASAESQLLALIENDRLVVYDLLTGGKLDQQQFPEAIAYVHFSADGKRLLVLTRKQSVYILDVSDAHNAALRTGSVR